MDLRRPIKPKCVYSYDDFIVLPEELILNQQI